jgi:hypothetical protein
MSEANPLVAAVGEPTDEQLRRIAALLGLRAAMSDPARKPPAEHIGLRAS